MAASASVVATHIHIGKSAITTAPVKNANGLSMLVNATIVKALVNPSLCYAGVQVLLPLAMKKKVLTIGKTSSFRTPS